MKKKMIRRLLSAGLVFTMSAGMLAGCGAGGGTDDNGGNSGGDSSAPDHIIVTYITAGVDPADLGKVQDAVNDITVPEINVEVEFKPLSFTESLSQYSMWIGAGEQIDLMCVAFQDLKSYIDQGMIEPLDDLLASEGDKITSLVDEEDFPLYAGAQFNDQTYAVTTLPQYYGNGGGFLMTKESLESAGLSYEDGDMVTLDDLTDIFAAIKEANPDVYPCGITGSLPPAGYTFQSDTLGATAASGALIGLDSTEVVNYFEAEEYYDFLEHVRDWYQKGYIPQDAATTDITLDEYMKSGTISGYFSEGLDGLKNTLEANLGKECLHLMLNEPYMKSISSASSVYWTVPVTAAEPEAAMRFLNMLYEDKDLLNTIQWGIKDTHYKVVDEENGIIERIGDPTAGTSGLGLWGDQRMAYEFGSSTKEANAKWTEDAMNNPTKGYGFAYDSSNMTNQIIAVQSVITEYQPALETGSADLESTYQAFIDKLKANGIDEIIADKQAQFDEWLAQQ